MRKVLLTWTICLTTALIFSCFPLPGQQAAAVEKTKEKTPAYNPDHKYPPKQLQEDFQLLRTALEEAHGGLYHYTPKKELDRQLDSIREKLIHPMTDLEFYRLAAPMIANINDGHTWLMFSKTYRDYNRKTPISFPFNLKFLKGKAYLFRNYSENADTPAMGSEVLTINGHSMAEILGKMLPLVPSDGHVETAKYRRLERTSIFDFLYTLLFGETSEYTIAFRELASGVEKTITAKGISGARMDAIFEERCPEQAKDKPPNQVEYQGDAAILTIRTFGTPPYKKHNISYPDFMKNTFSQLQEKKIQYLVIDLRNNSGGSDEFGKILFAYLYDQPFRYYESLRVKRVDLSFWDRTDNPKAKKLLVERTKKNQEGTYDAVGHPNLGEQQPLLPTFKGKVLVLINGGSFSATGECTSLIHYYKKAKFVGEECGAGYYGNTSGFGVSLTLPNTKLRIGVPMVRYSMAVSGYPQDRGIIPDYPIEPFIQDLIGGRDPVMEFALQQVRKEK